MKKPLHRFIAGLIDAFIIAVLLTLFALVVWMMLEAFIAVTPHMLAP